MCGFCSQTPVAVCPICQAVPNAAPIRAKSLPPVVKSSPNQTCSKCSRAIPKAQFFTVASPMKPLCPACFEIATKPPTIKASTHGVWHIVSNDVGTILAVYGAALLADANKTARRIARNTNAPILLHCVQGERPSVGMSISLRGTAERFDPPDLPLKAQLINAIEEHAKLIEANGFTAGRSLTQLAELLARLNEKPKAISVRVPSVMFHMSGGGVA